MANKRTKLRHKNPFRLPRKYKFVCIKKQRRFAYLDEYVVRDTKQRVIAKIPRFYDNSMEVSIMRQLKSLNFHQHNIVELVDVADTAAGPALVLENLDITLHRYLERSKHRAKPFSEIRSFVKQMATALDALKSIGVIHTNIEPKNIMLVDHQKCPLTFKLIDFSLATHACDVRMGKSQQDLCFRAPEVILGCPVTEAIDMWSLGILTYFMFADKQPFPGFNEYDVLRHIVHSMGQPPDHQLDAGLMTKEYFIRTENGWRFKTPFEYSCWPPLCWPFGIGPLDHLKTPLKEKNIAEAIERVQCVELLKAMLTVDPTKRITPSEVLNHPFIKMKYKCTHSKIPVHCSRSPTIPPSGVIYVRPATPENTLQLQEEDSAQVTKTPETVTRAPTRDCEPPATAPQDNDTSDVQPVHCSRSPTIPPSGVIYVRPATPENTLQLQEEDSAQVTKTPETVTRAPTRDCEPPATAPQDNDTPDVQPVHCSRSPTIPPSGVIYVRPATPENTLQLQEEDSAQVTKTPETVTRAPTRDCEPPATAPQDNDTSDVQPVHCSRSPTIPPSGVIYVRPATPENTLQLQEEDSAQVTKTPETVTRAPTRDCEPPATAPQDNDTPDVQPVHCSRSPTIPPSGVIYVRPATPENTLQLQETPEQTLESSVTLTENVSKLTENDTTSTPGDSRTCGQTQLPQSPLPEPEVSSMKKKKKKKKKKNCFQRFCSWMKNTFSSCLTCVDDDGAA